ncbi:hypothetical protein [Aliivibrio fischeri]|uniref:hypothetical protein n=1 Tax=Aliivibrio fischeri TaxID=668 RepID=UPI001F297B88|nr:hypothetical protein [Aliivibrio fischeri]MCE7535641.1 hypothetical protein [Aliivibrio fischeri]MCE7559193.1 hypothetical protein [Aliivibrio fischeri]
MVLAKYKEQLLNEFEQRTDSWSFGTFESRLSELRKGTSYHDAKGIINDAHKLGLWPNTVKRYLFTNYSSFGNVSSELNRTFNEIYSGLSDHEKAFWGIK